MSNEYLYNEIKIMDSSFSLAKFYYDLANWKRHYDMAKDNRWYRLYTVLSRYHIYDIYYDTRDVYGLHIYTNNDNLPNLYRDVSSMYRKCKILYPKGDEPYGSVHIEYDDSYEVQQAIGQIEQVMLFHPLLNIRYRASNIGGVYAYQSYKYHHTDPLYVVDEQYNEDLYNAIRLLDPSITMDSIYDVYVDKYNRENKVKGMYDRWLPIIPNIDAVWMTDDYIEIQYNSSTLDLDGWYVEENAEPLIRYRGSDKEQVYDDIVTMMRMYSSYTVPYAGLVGSLYFK